MLTTIVKAGASVLTAACLVVGLGACSSDGDTGSGASHSASVDAQHEALEAYAAKERAALASHDEFKDTYSSIKVAVTDPGTITFTYAYADQLDAAKVAAFLDGKVATFQSTFDDQVSPAMKATGVASDRKMVYTYLNADGSQLWTHTFE
ncbi:hypothetical protein GCM10025864_34910 [Luteimicrobium album]|uniref:Lipoprotein n=1 Tax=Luteimicrobium album TaxID=1054550 RepID=A0ABQ6I5I2_9MICO|nr:hypothetical protein [Luteimicrobium album]GMA25732.1 hypothetical protein GCM10025864_34910 [Luteimicrobium album]